MYKKVINFIKYNNAFTIVFIVCFFSSGIVFAASPTARDSIYSSKTTVVSIDNSLIISTDLDNFNFNLVINSVTDDDKNYYAAYSYQTLAIEDGVWQVEQVGKTLTVNKEALNGKDLGLYVAKELGDNINYELSYLKRVQALEKAKGQSQKVVAVEYSGLIGKLLNPRQEVIEGYNPVIPEVAATVEANQTSTMVTTANPEPQSNSTSNQNPTSSQTESTQEPTTTSTTTATTTATETETATTTATTTETTTPISEPATSTSEVTSEPTTDAATTSEVTSEPTTDAATTSDANSEPTQ